MKLKKKSMEKFNSDLSPSSQSSETSVSSQSDSSNNFTSSASSSSSSDSSDSSAASSSRLSSAFDSTSTKKRAKKTRTKRTRTASTKRTMPANHFQRNDHDKNEKLMQRQSRKLERLQKQHQREKKGFDFENFDYNNNFGVVSGLKMKFASPSIWGPRFWFVFHIATTVFPTKPSNHVSSAFFKFILSIPLLLPCVECRDHSMVFLTKNFATAKEAVQSRMGVFKFFVDFHNSVNERLGKKVMSLEEAMEFYGYDESEPTNDIPPTNVKLLFSSPEIWGPHYWFFLHTASVHYSMNPTPAMQDAFRNFIIVIPLLLPCMECRKHSTMFLQENLNVIERHAILNRRNAFKFLVDFHNHVNETKGTAQMPLHIAQNLYGYDEV